MLFSTNDTTMSDTVQQGEPADPKAQTDPQPEAEDGGPAQQPAQAVPQQPNVAPAPKETSGFLTRSLQKILAEKDTKKSAHAALRKACEAALG